MIVVVVTIKVLVMVAIVSYVQEVLCSVRVCIGGDGCGGGVVGGEEALSVHGLC